MSYEIPVLNLSGVAGADLSSSQYLVGKLNASGLVIVSTVAGAGGIGIIQDPVLISRTTSLMAYGVSKCIYGATVSAPGTRLTNNTAGKLVPISASTDIVVGIALEAGSADEQHAILLTNNTNNGLVKTLAIVPLQLAEVADGNVYSFKPGFAGTISSIQFSTTTAASTADKLATLGLKIGSTAVTGGAVALTTATVVANANIAGSAITANNAFSATDTITIVASSTTAFVEGQGNITLVLSQ